MKAHQITVSLSVICNSYRGTVIRLCEWSRNGDSIMVEVRVPGGLVCVCASELQRA